MTAIVETARLVRTILDQRWHRDCQIVSRYMPPFPRADTKPIVAVRHVPSNSFLRYSKGPRQGYFWDLYGDDMQTVEMAIVALGRAPGRDDHHWCDDSIIDLATFIVETIEAQP